MSIQGFKNDTMTNCFLDAPLLAMFGPYLVWTNDETFQTSRGLVHNDFKTALLDTPLTREHYDQFVDKRQCSRTNHDLDYDMIANRVQPFLIQMYESIKAGRQTSCTNFRKFLLTCDVLKEMGNLKTQHNADEFYMILLSLFGYSPMLSFTTTVYYKLNDQNKLIGVCGETATTLSEVQATPVIRLNVARAKQLLHNEEERVSVYDAFQDKNILHLGEPIQPRCGLKKEGVFTRFESGTGPFVSYEKMETFLFKCDVLVVAIDRESYMDFKTKRMRVVDEIIEVPLEIELTTRAKISNNPFFYEQIRREDLNAKLSDYRQYVKQPFRLLSAVISMHSLGVADEGHFLTLLQTPKSALYRNEPPEKRMKGANDDEETIWVLYDDLRPGPQPISDERAIDMLSKHAVMLFYFPYGPSVPLQV